MTITTGFQSYSATHSQNIKFSPHIKFSGDDRREAERDYARRMAAGVRDVYEYIEDPDQRDNPRLVFNLQPTRGAIRLVRGYSDFRDHYDEDPEGAQEVLVREAASHVSSLIGSAVRAGFRRLTGGGRREERDNRPPRGRDRSQEAGDRFVYEQPEPRRQSVDQITRRDRDGNAIEYTHIDRDGRAIERITGYDGNRRPVNPYGDRWVTRERESLTRWPR